jgi:hypothetical protein
MPQPCHRTVTPRIARMLCELERPDTGQSEKALECSVDALEEPIVANHSSVTLTLLALLSTVIAMGVLAAVIGLFQSEGMPLARLAAAERACIQHAFISERETCMREWLAASRRPTVAKK